MLFVSIIINFEIESPFKLCHIFQLSGLFIFTIGLYNLAYFYRVHYTYGNFMKNCTRKVSKHNCIAKLLVLFTGGNSLAWTTSASVMMFGLMSILTSYCSHCAICTKDLSVTVLVISMQNCMIILQILTQRFIDQKWFTWHSILGHLIKSNRILNFVVGFVFIIHVS